MRILDPRLLERGFGGPSWGVFGRVLIQSPHFLATHQNFLGGGVWFKGSSGVCSINELRHMMIFDHLEGCARGSGIPEVGERGGDRTKS